MYRTSQINDDDVKYNLWRLCFVTTWKCNLWRFQVRVLWQLFYFRLNIQGKSSTLVTYDEAENLVTERAHSVTKFCIVITSKTSWMIIFLLVCLLRMWECKFFYFFRMSSRRWGWNIWCNLKMWGCKFFCFVRVTMRSRWECDVLRITS
jgi:hypothetical protein